MTKIYSNRQKKFPFRLHKTIYLIRFVGVSFPFRLYYGSYIEARFQKSAKLLLVMVYNEYTKLQILQLKQEGLHPPAIKRYLRGEECIKISTRGVAKFIKRVLERGKFLLLITKPWCVFACWRYHRSWRFWQEDEDNGWNSQIVERQMRLDDETTASQLYVLLSSLGHHLNLRMILRCRTSLGWTFCGSAYCQLIRQLNKQKRLDFAREHQNDNFMNVVFTDECSVQLESHRRRCCRKQGDPVKNKPRLASFHCKYDVRWYFPTVKTSG